MDSKKETKLSMYIAVRDYLVQFITMLNTLPNFPTLYTALQNVITEIQSSGEQQAFDKSGNTTDKNQLKKLLVTLAADTARKLAAYASFTGNQVLFNEANIKESRFKRMSGTLLISSSQGIYDLAQANIANLEKYLINEDTQTALQTAITNFNQSFGKPRIGKVEISQATKKLVLLFTSGDETIDGIDTAVDIVRLSEPNFFIGYKSARKLINTGTGTLAIKGLVSDAATGKPLKGAKLRFVLDGFDSLSKFDNGKTGFTKKSAKKGGFYVRNAAEGTYTVTIELPGYKKVTATVSVVSGQMSVLNVVLERA